MSTSATAYGGGVPAGGFVASLQSIVAVGLGAPVILVIGGVAVVVTAAGLAWWSSKETVAAAASASATSYWTSPIVRIGTGAVAGAIVGWTVCFLVENRKILNHL
ncbi:hypothetical protein L917_03645 [Phytophthora nicotianae]|uniref:Uncharacterized protein n=1 Tax=Phytophthora nicotianae TaxID=4792 RepID=W2LQ37_PHYNI|nr:hypothetical protein L917_03645 [Phytophthora nicotianae]